MNSGQDLRKEFAANLVTACVSHLFSLLGTNGKFVYAHKQFAPDQVIDGYNLLRHCGTVWFMCKAIKILGIELEPSQQQALSAALGYIRKKTKEPPWEKGPIPVLCLVTKDAVKLGGVGLAALMIRQYVELDDLSEGSSADLYPEGAGLHCIRLENYIVSQLSGSDFIHKRDFSTGVIHPFRSDYYTGEALFALMQSPRRVPQVRTVMERLLDEGYGLPEQSHWMAYAACAALKVGYCGRSKTVNYLKRLVDRIISDSSYRERHQSTPIACRTEALVEFLQTCRMMDSAYEDFPKPLVEAAAAVARQNLELQLKYYGQGQFRKGRESDKVQIDYVQHNGAAFLGWSQLSEI